MIFHDVCEPRLSDYDQCGYLSYEALLQILENTGTKHTMAVYDKVADAGIAWVLVDWRIEISKRPKQFQRLQISTWVHGKAPASTAQRSYVVTDDEGQEFLKACAKFALVDLKEQKMTRISEELFNSYQPEQGSAFENDAPRLKEQNSYESIRAITLRRSDIDYNGHVHNVRYLDFALDLVPEEEYAEDSFTKLHIVYHSAVKPDSQPEIRRAAVDGGYLFVIYADGKVSTMVELRK